MICRSKKTNHNPFFLSSLQITPIRQHQNDRQTKLAHVKINVKVFQHKLLAFVCVDPEFCPSV